MTTATATSSLPTSRTLLTNLINAISAIPLTPSPSPTTANRHQTPNPSSTQNDNKPPPPRRDRPSNNNNYDDVDGGGGDDNPLRRVPPSHRHLVATLHVLFPGLVLPALDLLERGLVAGVSPRGSGSGSGLGLGSESGVVLPRRAGGGDDDASARVGGGGGGAGGEEARARSDSSKRAFYLVQSAAAAEAAREKRRRRRRKRGDGDGGDGAEAVVDGKAYLVRLDAWHCSCAAFAFAAVQDGGAGFQGWENAGRDAGPGDTYKQGVSVAEQEEVSLEGGLGTGWSFGGMSSDGLTAGAAEGVPVCKHLLACVLAERWHAALGRYVVERCVGREEMAGIAADV